MNDHVSGTMAGILNNVMPKENALPSVPSNALLGLSVEHKGDECWLTFSSSKKRRAAINLTMLSKTHDPLVRLTIEEWIDDIRWLHGLGPVRPNRDEG